MFVSEAFRPRVFMGRMGFLKMSFRLDLQNGSRIAVTMSLFAWIVGLVFASVWPLSGLGRTVYGLASYTCHQQPERCLEFLGIPMPVCARCAGIWIGTIVGCVWFWHTLVIASERTQRVLGLAIGVIVVDWIGGARCYWDTPGAGRLATGLPIGLVVVSVFAAYVRWLVILASVIVRQTVPTDGMVLTSRTPNHSLTDSPRSHVRDSKPG
jgi:uncharacterized membrane protein